MKKFILFAATALLLGASQSLMNCADPLESSQGRILNPPIPEDTVYTIDTVVIIDTVGATDTVIIVDTIGIIDTIWVVDTVGIIDTVVVIDTVMVEIPTLDSQFVCARISCNQKEIVWLLRNQAGLYRLEFAGEVENDQPVQTLKIDIDGAEYLWNPAADVEFVKELTLGKNATIRITPKKPPAFGHAIDICLKITALD